VLAENSTGWLASLMGDPGAALHRADLQSELCRAAGEDRIRLGQEVSGYRVDPVGATLLFRDGSEERGDVVVAADDIRSVLRRQLLGGGEPRNTGI
jgi:2-polyprenyl-6-methoxyphenol hydroxylase-like FAD-dependent oxidoreductase